MGLSLIDDRRKHLEECEHLQRGWKMSELFVVFIEKDIGENGAGKEWRGPLVWPTLLDMPQRSSVDRCCRSSCFFLRGFRVSGRTEKPRSCMSSKQ